MLSLFKYTVDKSFDHVHYLHCNIYLYNLSIQNFLPQLPLLFQNVVIVFCVRCNLRQKCRLEQVLVLLYTEYEIVDEEERGIMVAVEQSCLLIIM